MNNLVSANQPSPERNIFIADQMLTKKGAEISRSTQLKIDHIASIFVENQIALSEEQLKSLRNVASEAQFKELVIGYLSKLETSKVGQVAQDIQDITHLLLKNNREILFRIIKQISEPDVSHPALRKWAQAQLLGSKFQGEAQERLKRMQPPLPTTEENIQNVSKDLLLKYVDSLDERETLLLEDQISIYLRQHPVEASRVLQQVKEKGPFKTPVEASKPVRYTLDKDYICSKEDFKFLSSFLAKQQELFADFNVRDFIIEAGQKYSSFETNAKVFLAGLDLIKKVAQALAKHNNIPLDKAYKLLVGAADQYDAEQTKLYQTKKVSPAGTFPLRAAILSASHEEGVGLESWTVYTKGGKPVAADMWRFVEVLRNWVPEVQGIMGKYIETAMVKARQLAETSGEQRVVLLKGGSGAGKSRFIEQLFKDKAGGVMAPDDAKAMVRRVQPDISHSAAHIQGLTVAHEMFLDMLQNVSGTVSYDSTLTYVPGLKNFIQKAQSAGKKAVIYDITRKDTARFLSVLKRGVVGKDPRVPPKYLVSAAVLDKMGRVECMQIVLNSKPNKAGTDPEYHFIGSDKYGTNTEEVLHFGPGKIMMISPKAAERLALEGIKVDPKTLEVSYLKDKKKMEEDYNIYYELQMERPVDELLKELSGGIQQDLELVFASRVLAFANVSAGIMLTPDQLYEQLDPKVQKYVSKRNFVEAFERMKPAAYEALMKKIAQTHVISYLDLPLGVALHLHYTLRKDPWL